GRMRRPERRGRLAAGQGGCPLEGPEAWGNGPSHLDEHEVDGRDTRHRLDFERRHAVRVRAREPPIDVDGAPAHPAHGLDDVEAGIRGLDYNQLLAGPEVVEDADDLD